MENMRKEVVETFIKYITGVYVLQQDFIEDMRGGLQAVLEKYEIGVAGSTIVASAVQEQPTEVQAAPKKTRKKSTKKDVEVPKEVQVLQEVEKVEVVEAVEANEEPDMQEAQEVQEEDVVQDLQDLQDLQEEQVVEDPEVQEEQNEDVAIVPSHVKESINENAEKKKRKPRTTKKEKEIVAQQLTENGEVEVKEKKTRGTSPWKVFMTEFSKNTSGKKMTMSERGPLMSAEWAVIKNDPERFKVYQQKADELNKEKGL